MKVAIQLHILKFRKINDKTANGQVIYAGEQEQTVDGIRLTNFTRTARIIR